MNAALSEWPRRPSTPPGVEAVPRGRRGQRRWDFRTRWTDPATGRRRPAVFRTVAEVEAFRASLRLARAHGRVADINRGEQQLERFVELEWWPDAGRRLERNTLRNYAGTWNNHLAPQIGHLQLRHITPSVVVRLAAELVDAGVGQPTVLRTLAVLQGICSYAVQLEQMTGNPVREIRKPPVTRHLAIQAPSVTAIEALRAQLPDARDRALVSLIAYTGLRPSEARALQQRHIGRATILVEQRVIDGRVVPGLKNARNADSAHRSPALYQGVRADLDEHLDGATRRGNLFLFARDDGAPWTERDYRRWRERTFQPAVKLAGLDLDRPYNLRHGCASLLLHAGRPLTEIADYMGHSVVTLDRYYRHIIADLVGTEPTPIEQQIAAARHA